MSATITAKCNHCGTPVSKASDAPDDMEIVCTGCGAKLGTYPEIIAAMKKAGVDLYKKELSKIVSKINRKR